MSKFSKMGLELSVGCHSVRAWLDYGKAIPEGDSARLVALKGSIEDLKKEASNVESEEGEIYANVLKDVAPRMDDWSALEGEAADVYVERTKTADAQTLKDVEDAYEDDTNVEVTEDDVTYTRIYLNMLDFVFEMKRLQYKCQALTETHTVYEDRTFKRAEEIDDITAYTLFMPTKEEALNALMECMDAFDEKYIGGEFPEAINVTYTLGLLTPEDDAGCIDALKELDELMVKKYGFTDDTLRIYHYKIGNRPETEYPEYMIGI